MCAYIQLCAHIAMNIDNTCISNISTMQREKEKSILCPQWVCILLQVVVVVVVYVCT